MMLSRTLRRLVSIAALACALSCAAEDRAPTPATEQVTLASPLGAAAWVERVRGAHAAADAEVASANLDRAIEKLNAALELSVPPRVRADHARAMQQDLGFRIAELELRQGRPQLALGVAERGLALGSGRDLFTANLLIACGEALEGLDRDTEAAARYYEALQINAALLRTALGSSDAGAP